MGFIEHEIELCERRIKKIDESPDPNRLKSNKMAYELELDLRVDLLRAWHEGQPFGAINIPFLLFQATGLGSLDFNQAANRRSAQMPAVSLERLHDLRAKGFPYNCCDGALMGVDMVITGELPKPAVVVDWGTCEPLTMANTAMAKWCGSHLFHLDVPFEVNDDTLEYVTAQLREFIGFVESKIPGARYDEDKLIELQELNRIAMGYFHDSYELRKHVPCPIPARDALRLPRMPSDFPDPRKGLEWIRIWRDELQDRVNRGTSTAGQ
ncbi:MAG: 2-hydroxyacyl-CoA dehydratase family protein, partial [Dehalococcoidia bacterium]|nr:2-hydroxyacyl-CoA dehydratase family protein [Dehalococcoidia bacterium]